MKFNVIQPILLTIVIIAIQANTIAQLPKEKEAFIHIKERVQELILKNIDSAEIYANQLQQIAKKLNSDTLLAEALSSLSLVKIYKGRPEEALQLNKESFLINKRLNIKKELAKNYYRFGTINGSTSNFVEATRYYLQSVEIAAQEKMYALSQKNYRKLSGIAVNQQKFTDALQYANKAIEVAKLAPADISDEAENLLNIATCYKYLKKNNEAEASFKAAFELYKKDNQHFKMADVLCEMASIYKEKDLLKSISISFQAQHIFDSIAPESITSINNMGNLGEKLFNLSQDERLIKLNKNTTIPFSKKEILKSANTYLTKAIELSKQQNISQAILYYSGLLSDVQAYNGDFKDAYKNLQFKFTYNDSLYSQENKNAIAKLESEREVTKLATENQQKSTLNNILIGSATGLSLFSLLGYRNFKAKQKVSAQQQQIQQQKINELEKDKQLLTIDAMLKGQEEERSRIAKDLHDGLGGMLSGTKLSFMNMKENLVLTPENAAQFDKSLSLLDTTIGDLRKVAHNLMPEALVKFGLNEATRDFCDNVKGSSGINIVYQYLGEQRKLEATAEVFTYRILQELVNNAVKHAGATHIFVQLTMDTSKLYITVEDDGKGFSINDTANSKGAGLSNIKYRVQYLNGTIDVITAPGNGTSVNIELKA